MHQVLGYTLMERSQEMKQHPLKSSLVLQEQIPYLQVNHNPQANMLNC